jgi:hypothetical protein
LLVGFWRIINSQRLAMEENVERPAAIQATASSDQEMYSPAQSQPLTQTKTHKQEHDLEHDLGQPTDAAPQYADVKSISFILVVAALSFSLFCVGLDNIIIATAIPRITDEFNAINDIAW